MLLIGPIVVIAFSRDATLPTNIFFILSSSSFPSFIVVYRSLNKSSAYFTAFFSPWRIYLEPKPDFHFSRCQSMPPDVKSWTTFFTNFYFRRAATSRRKSLIFLDIPPFFSLAVYFFALIFIFTDDDLGSLPFSIL